MIEEFAIHVELCQRAESTLAPDVLEQAVRKELNYETFDTILYGKDYPANTILHDHVETIIFSNDSKRQPCEIEKLTFKYDIYRLTLENPATEIMNYDSDQISVATHWVLPTKDFQNLWESLYYDCNIKNKLLNFAKTILLFSDHNVDPNIISCNKVILLHGPPGTGKTSLCKALAQKLSIRLGDRFTNGMFIEINSHSLFSKWFSESGKLVMKLFDEIKIMVQNKKLLICILIDEVESLAHARKLSITGNEPSDSIRVVNALLTQLDQIKQHPNVLILTTSNMTEAIDLAFINRADIKQYLGYPSTEAIYNIYYSCLKELMKSKILEYEEICSTVNKYKLSNLPKDDNSAKLLKISTMSKGLTGRTLRKIPFLAYSLHLSPVRNSVSGKKITLSEFLEFMDTTIELNQIEDPTTETVQKS